MLHLFEPNLNYEFILINPQFEFEFELENLGQVLELKLNLKLGAHF
jgi:hypothetical protein